MKEPIVNWGIIGCGNVTEVKSGPAFSKVPQSKLVAVMRRNGAKAADYAARHGVPRWYNNSTDLINDPDVNAIYIATPPLQHEAYTLQALQAGKPVYVEKPMALTTVAAQNMVAAAAQTGTKLCVAHYRRQQPLFKKIKSLLEQGTIGDVRLVQLKFLQSHQSDMIAKTDVPWRLDPALSGGGLFYDLAPHHLDLMLYFFGAPQKVTGLSFNAAGLYKADDTTSGQVLFNNGILFNGLWCFTASENVDECEIIGTAGSIRFSVFATAPVRLLTGGIETRFDFETLPHVQQPMIEKVVAYFLNGSANPCTGAEGVAVMEMIETMAKPNNQAGYGALIF